ncbi:MAG: hypothetical protein HYT80_00340 [Euryarchaeota archaeon]|nr:hypothetical protein [Euryarchaeota archaeon]
MRAVATAFIVVAVAFAGCAKEEPSETRVGRSPFPWDEEAPDRSEIAAESYYVLKQSSSFLVKGSSYGRYVFRVDHTFEDVDAFFTSTNRYAPPGVRRPNVNDAAYHFEFMQIRPLGKSIRVMDVNAGPAFGNASAGHAYTLTYIYGKGANYEYIAPFDGNPHHWRLDPGFYELIVATDENLTVGVNLGLGTPLWTTHYHPQELGSARAEALNTYVKVFPGSPPRALHESFDEVVDAKAGETLNYFAFASLYHRSNFVSVGSQGVVRVRVDDKEVPHRLEATGFHALQPQQREAYAYAVSFNQPGPAQHEIRTHLDFEQLGSFQSDLVGQMLIFAVALQPKLSHEGAPRPTEP